MGQYSKKTDHRSVYDDNMKKRIVQKENAILNLQNQILEKRRAMIKVSCIHIICVFAFAALHCCRLLLALKSNTRVLNVPNLLPYRFLAKKGSGNPQEQALCQDTPHKLEENVQHRQVARRVVAPPR